MTERGADHALLSQLSLDERTSVLSGRESWSLPAIPAIGLDAIVTSHGPLAVRVRNTGRRRGKEVVRLYLGSEDEYRRRRELKAFRCIELDAGAETDVTFALGGRAFPRWHPQSSGFLPVVGRHEVAVGRSSRDLRLTRAISFSSRRTLAEPFVGRRG
jgi:fibronectin type III domain protein